MFSLTAADAPLALSPLALSPFALNPFALSPFALNPFALSPFALNPFALSPFALNPFALRPFMLDKAPSMTATPGDRSHPASPKQPHTSSSFMRRKLPVHRVRPVIVVGS